MILVASQQQQTRDVIPGEASPRAPPILRSHLSCRRLLINTDANVKSSSGTPTLPDNPADARPIPFLRQDESSTRACSRHSTHASQTTSLVPRAVARHPLAVHFCSEQHENAYIRLLFDAPVRPRRQRVKHAAASRMGAPSQARKLVSLDIQTQRETTRSTRSAPESRAQSQSR